MESIGKTILSMISEITVIPIFYALIASGQSKIISAIIAIVIALLINAGLISINNNLIVKSKKYRKKALYFSRFEGIWIQKATTNEIRPYSIARFEYDIEERQFKYYGDAYGTDGSKAHWETTDISRLDDAKPGFKYSGTASTTFKNGKSNSFKNYGWLTFTSKDMTSFGDFVAAEGSVIDYGLGEDKSVEKTELEIEYCTKEDMIKYLGKDSVNSMNDIKKLFKKMRENSEEN